MQEGESTVASPLAGVRVLDLTTGISGGYAGKLLADAGADVLSIEAVEGDLLRRRGIAEASFDDEGDGLLYRYLYANKRAMALDLESSSGAAALRRLFKDCDLVLDSTNEGFLEERDLGEATLLRQNPRASWISISAFGRGNAFSRRPANDFTLQAACGSTASRGRSGLPPIHAGGEVGDWLSGTCLAVAALAALRKADRDGRGSRVDVSKLEAITPTLTNAGSVWGYFSDVWALPASEDVPSIEPTADGWIGFCIFTAQQWQDFSVLIERPELGLDPQLNHMMTRVQRAAELGPIVRAYTERFTTAELLERSELLRVPAAPIGNGAILPEIDHLKERGVFVPNPRGGFLQPRVPYRSSGWASPAFGAAPSMDESRKNGENVDSENARAWANAPRPQKSSKSKPNAHPLEGLRVLDLTAFWAGPYGTYMLSGLGADVIHVESIQRPDGMRFGTMASPDTESWWELGPTFHSANAGKRSLTLDLTREEGVTTLLELVAKSDVVVENFSPRVMDNFGLTAERIAAANPEAIFVRMPAFGLDGPWRERVGFAQTMEQVSGLAWMTSYGPSAGEKAGPLTPRACADPLAGLHAAFATLAALEHRDRTGEGCTIESVMVETVLNVTAEGVIEYDATQMLMEGDGNRSPHYAPQDLYDCADRDELGAPARVALCVDRDAQWPGLAELIGRSEWARDPGFLSAMDRRGRADEIDSAISVWARERSAEEAGSALRAREIPAEVVMASRLGTSLLPIEESDFVQPANHALAGRVPTPTHPFRFVSGPGRALERAAPLLGEHNREILRDLLGRTEAGMDEMQEQGLIGNRPVGL